MVKSLSKVVKKIILMRHVSLVVPVIDGFCRQPWHRLKFGPKINHLFRGKGFKGIWIFWFFLLPFYFVSLSKAVIPASVISLFQSGFCCCFALLKWPHVSFCHVFPNFWRLLVVVVMVELEVTEPDVGQGRFTIPGIALSKADKKELWQYELKGSFEIVIIFSVIYQV